MFIRAPRTGASTFPGNEPCMVRHPKERAMPVLAEGGFRRNSEEA